MLRAAFTSLWLTVQTNVFHLSQTLYLLDLASEFLYEGGELFLLRSPSVPLVGKQTCCFTKQISDDMRSTAQVSRGSIAPANAAITRFCSEAAPLCSCPDIYPRYLLFRHSKSLWASVLVSTPEALVLACTPHSFII